MGHIENPRPRISAARDRRSRDRTAPYFVAELEARASAFSDDILTPSTIITQHEAHPLPEHANDDHPCASNDNPEPRTEPLTRKQEQDARDTRHPPDWKRTRDGGKLTACNRVITLGDLGTPRTFTLNLAPDTITRGLASAHNGFASWMQKRINREIIASMGFPLPFVFAVDVTRSGRPHLHGMVAANDDHMPGLDTALRRAGGLWKGAYSQKQTHYDLVWDTDGWTRYSGRNLAAARKVVGFGVIAGTKDLKASARELHERLRMRMISDRHK